MPKFKIRWSETQEYEEVIEASCEHEAERLVWAGDHNFTPITDQITFDDTEEVDD